MEERVFTSGQVCEITKVPYHRLDYWAKRGILVPAIEAAGSNTARGYSASDVMAVAVLVAMGDIRDSSILRRVASYCQRPGTCHNHMLFISETIREGASASMKEILAIAPGPVFVLHLGTLRARIERGVAALKPHTRGKVKNLNN